MQTASKSTVRILRSDMTCLRSLLRRKSASDDAQSESLDRLQDALDSAQVLEALPTTVVALGTRFWLRNLDSNEKPVYMLVLPSEADISEGMISILAPLGTAVLGRGVGDVFHFDAPGGTMRFRLEGILSHPEASRSHPHNGTKLEARAM
jgi:regulator of nucleoside diphosphate kinase